MDPEKLDGYGKSKVNAEKAAWDYVKELPGNYCSANSRVVIVLSITR